VFPLDIIEAAARSAEEGCSLQVPHPHKPNFPLTFIGEGNSHAERSPGVSDLASRVIARLASEYPMIIRHRITSCPEE
jgi:hypothetical protein